MVNPALLVVIHTSRRVMANAEIKYIFSGLVGLRGYLLISAQEVVLTKIKYNKYISVAISNKGHLISNIFIKNTAPETCCSVQSAPPSFYAIVGIKMLDG